MIKFSSGYFGELLFVALLAAILLPVSGVQGKNQAKAQQKALEDMAQADLTLVGHLAQSPELMNVDYLECYLGPKNSTANGPSTNPHRGNVPAMVTVWRDPGGQYVPYKLETSRLSPTDYNAEFSIANSPSNRLRLKDLDKILNLSSQPSYDEQGKPMDVYETRSDTKVLVYQTPGVADINRIRVSYAGNVLPPPSATDMQEAMQYRHDQAIAQQKLGNHEQAAQLLKAHVRNNPMDAEAHLKLAESYKAQCRLNDAISEYRIALDRSGDDDQLRQECIKGLHSLKVDIPTDQAVSHTSVPVHTAGTNTAATAATAPAPVQSHERININQPLSVPPIINNPALDPSVGF